MDASHMSFCLSNKWNQNSEYNKPKVWTAVSFPQLAQRRWARIFTCPPGYWLTSRHSCWEFLIRERGTQWASCFLRSQGSSLWNSQGCPHSCVCPCARDTRSLVITAIPATHISTSCLTWGFFSLDTIRCLTPQTHAHPWVRYFPDSSLQIQHVPQ